MQQPDTPSETDALADSSPPFERLVAIMARLRDPVRGCPWDVEQTFATIAPYTIEEAYEVADAIQQGDLVSLCGRNWATSCCRSSFMPAWPRKPAPSTSRTWREPSARR